MFLQNSPVSLPKRRVNQPYMVYIIYICSAKESYISAKQPCLSAKNPCTRALYGWLVHNPTNYVYVSECVCAFVCVCARMYIHIYMYIHVCSANSTRCDLDDSLECYVCSAYDPYISAKEPCFSAKEP